jgi:hypothetical protein
MLIFRAEAWCDKPRVKLLVLVYFRPEQLSDRIHHLHVEPYYRN